MKFREVASIKSLRGVQRMKSLKIECTSCLIIGSYLFCAPGHLIGVSVDFQMLTLALGVGLAACTSNKFVFTGVEGSHVALLPPEVLRDSGGR